MTNPWFFEVLPNHPAPYPDECLSGYLLRLADANRFTRFWELASDLFPSWSSPQQVIRLRWEYLVEDWSRLALRAYLPLDDLKRLTVAPWLEKFRPPLDLAHSIYLSPGHSLRGVMKPALQVCPLCLQGEPYLRLIWRLASVSACLEHGCLLPTHCQACGTPLRAISPAQRHLRCAKCEADLRGLATKPAPAQLLVDQRACETGLRFLLYPDVHLVAGLPPGSPDLPGAIGLKFRYLRAQAKRSLADVARQLGVHHGTLSGLELGQRTPLALYLAYLEQFGLSWLEFAALAVPSEFVQACQLPSQLALRICPTVDCPNHTPPSQGVIRLADLPERRIARFRCRACGRRFTRSYEGTLLTKSHKPVIQPGDAPTVPKSPREIARLKAMGLRGEDNHQIAHQLGWGEKTVRMYWIALGLEDRVHQAQAQRQAREQRQRHAARRAQVEAVLRTHALRKPHPPFFQTHMPLTTTDDMV